MSSWLRDYVYIGLLGGNRRGRWRTYLNVMLTYLFSGLWHGVGWTYLVWGGAQGLLQVFEGMARHAGRLRDDPHGPAFALRAAGVFLLNAALLTIFRAPTLRDGLAILAGQFRGLGAGSFVRQCAAAIGAGFNATPLLMAAWAAFCAVGLAAVVASDLLRRFRLQGECLAVWLGRQRAAVRWCIYYGLLAFVAAAFLMQNGNYVGSVSFAYGGF